MSLKTNNNNSKNNNNKKSNPVWDFIKQIFTIEASVVDETFSLGEREAIDIPDALAEQNQAYDKKYKTQEYSKSKLKKPRKIYPKNISDYPEENNRDERGADNWDIAKKIAVNLKRVKKTFIMPTNKDMVIREFYIALEKPVKAFIVFIDGAVNSKLVDDNILAPLMLLANLDEENRSEKNSFDIVNERLTPINQVLVTEKFKAIVNGVLNGDTAIFVDGSDQAMVVETKGWPGRSVSTPKNENTIRGPQEAFAENFRINTGLIRKRLRNEGLVTEIFQIGEYTHTNVALMYIDGIINPKLVREMRRRLKSIKIDYAAESGIIEQYIDDNPRSFVPTVMATERPDRVTAFLVEGHLAIIVDGATYALIMPITFWAQLHTPEDYYLKWPFATFLRWLRFIAFFMSMLTPAIYIAITNYHPEMIPTDLLFSIAATREKVPFPVVVEVLLMDFSFELIREAGVRIPGIIGPTLGIVGALILGQAAVAASIVSPILVIIVAITGLASSALPNYSFNLSVRLIRFVFILFAAVFGFVGIAALLFILNIHTMGLKSLGVPMVSPVAPFRPGSPDLVALKENYKFQNRTQYLRPLKLKRQAQFNRIWDPVTQKLAQEVMSKGKEGGNNNAQPKNKSSD